MKFAVVVHHDEGSAYGVTVPDLPGCFSAGDTFDDALQNVVEAIEGHLEILAEDGEPIPTPGDIEAHKANPDFADGEWATVELRGLAND